MREKASDMVKENVIRLWLQGYQRDSIANELHLGTGTVSSIVLEWRSNIGIPDVGSIRQFATELHGLGLSASECALGCRILEIIKKLGINERDFELFANSVYRYCSERNIPPADIVNISEQISLSNHPVPISQLPEYIQSQSDEANKLKSEVKALKEEIEAAQNEKDRILQNSKLTSEIVEEFAQSKDLLLEYGLSLKEVHNLAKVIHELDYCKHDAATIINKLSTIEDLEKTECGLQERVFAENERLRKVTEECSYYEQQLISHKLALGLCQELESLGIGLKELKLLRSLVVEISSSHNNLSPEFAFKKFFRDIECQYDKKLAFQVKLTSIENRLLKSKKELHDLSIEYAKKKDVLDILAELNGYGITQENIIQWSQIIKENSLNLSVLGSDLLKYGQIRNAYNSLSTNVQNLKAEEDDLKKRLNNRRNAIARMDDIHKLVLEQFTASMETLTITSVNKINYTTNTSIKSMQNHEQQIKLTGENVITTLQNLERKVAEQFDLLQKIGSTFEFSPLIKAARGQEVDANDLKSATIRAIDIMISRLNGMENGITINRLGQARNSLKSECLLFN
ncbi:MAG TPA: hypothetical protein VH796_08900 [Nitrososphaeraceae archaeon]